MRGGYATLYTRRVFEVADPAKLRRLLLRVDYDDGFAAYLNGQEVARANLGAEGSEVGPGEFASGRHEAGVPAEFDLGLAGERLVAGKNVIAVEVHNDDLNSSDVSLIVELEGRAPPPAAAGAVRLLINEASAGRNGAGAFVEIYNAGSGDMNLEGHWLTDDGSNLKKLRISGPAVLRPQAFHVVDGKDFDSKFKLSGPEVFLALAEPGGTAVLDAVRLRSRRSAQDGKAKEKDKTAAARSTGPKAKDASKEATKKKKEDADDDAREPALAAPRGRFPDGSADWAFLDAPTPSKPNQARIARDVVINEILYHSISGSEDDEFVELHNKGKEPATLSGYRLRGAVQFDFPQGTVIAPGGFVVAAKNPKSLAAKYGLAAAGVLGPYEGSLSGRGEEIVLRDPAGNAADRVVYADRDPWPHWADGLGSSLELIDPELDNSLPQSWAASDSSSQAKWEGFTYRKKHRVFEGRNFSELQFMLLQQGECLIDDVRVSGAVADTFEKGANDWTALGTHERSGLSQGDAASGKSCYRIVADGRGNARTNYVSRAIPGGLSPSMTYTITFRAKWVRGSPMLLTRTPGQGIALAHRLFVPSKIGTPGAVNSTRKSNAPPSLGTPSQTPIAPAANEPVTMAVRISARTAVRTASIHYRSGDADADATAPLRDDGADPDLTAGDGVFTGRIPGQGSGKVSFYLSAADEAGAEGFFPVGAPRRMALYGVGILPSKKFPTYTLLVTDAQWEALQQRPRMSNRLLDATLVDGTSRIFYNVGLRRRGSPFTRSTRNWRVVFGDESVDGRTTLTLDGQGGDGTRLNERLTHWLADQLATPNARQQYVHFRLLGHEEGVYEDVEKIDKNYIERWFTMPFEESEAVAAAAAGDAAKRAAAERATRRKRAAEARLHKIDDYWELSTQGEQAYREAQFTAVSADPEDYRWNFPPRGDSVDLTALVKLVQLLDPKATPDKAFDERCGKALDADEWLRVLAARAMADDWDTIGRTRGKNALLYLAPEDGRWRLLPWDCDLAWQQNPRSPLFTGKFPGVERLLNRPIHRRKYLGYLYYLAARSLEPESFGSLLGDLHARTGAETRQYANFASARRTYVLSQMPRQTFQVADSRRVERSSAHDILRAGGLAPPSVLRIRLNGREGSLRLVGEDRWIAELPLGPDGGDFQLEGLDFGGNVVGTVAVKVRARPQAAPLPPVSEIVSIARAPTLLSEPPDSLEADAPADSGASPASKNATAPSGAADSATQKSRATGAAAEARRTGDDPSTIEIVAKRLAESGREIRGENAGDSPGAANGTASPDASEAAGRHEAESEGALGDVDEGGRLEPSSRADLRSEAQPVGPAGAPGSSQVGGGPAGGSTGWWRIVAVGALALGALQIGLVVISRKLQRPVGKRRARAASTVVVPPPDARQEPAAPAPQHETAEPEARKGAAPASAADALRQVASRDYSTAEAALRRLSTASEKDVPAIIAALEDIRPTPFFKIRRGPSGLSAAPCEGPSRIQVRHVATLLLELILGKPPGVERPGPREWASWWKDPRRSPGRS
jgi:hypothetical protein